MNRSPGRRERFSARAAGQRALAGALLASALLAGCDRPFVPFQENTNGPFSIVGYLDLRADTQWVRVMPIRQNLLTEPDPIDAVVTLEPMGSGRTITMKDSVFSYQDPELDAVAYAHVFWTPERLEAKARYRLTATRSDRAASSAVVEMPAELAFTFLNLRDTAQLQVQAERLLLVETFHTMTTPSGDRGSGERYQPIPSSLVRPGLYFFTVDGSPLFQIGMVDARRTELRIVAGRSDWPFGTARPGARGSLPDTVPSNVENGLGYLGAAATWTIPFHRCAVLASRVGSLHSCAMTYDGRSASVSGRVIRQPCGRPHVLANVDLVETFADGGAALVSWKTGWNGEYRFEGIEPGADLLLRLGPTFPAVSLPRLAPAQRYIAPDIFVTEGC